MAAAKSKCERACKSEVSRRQVPGDGHGVAQVLPRERLARLDQVREVLLLFALAERLLVLLKSGVERLRLSVLVAEDIDLLVGRIYV